MTQLLKMTSVTKPCCRNCMYAFVMKQDGGEHRCGLTYYQLPALERHVRAMKTYPKVRAMDVCEDWKLTEKNVESL